LSDFQSVTASLQRSMGLFRVAGRGPGHAFLRARASAPGRWPDRLVRVPLRCLSEAGCSLTMRPAQQAKSVCISGTFSTERGPFENSRRSRPRGRAPAATGIVTLSMRPVRVATTPSGRWGTNAPDQTSPPSKTILQPVFFRENGFLKSAAPSPARLQKPGREVNAGFRASLVASREQ
jgi:hypothetical protein